MNRRTVSAIAVIVVAASSALAQSNVNPNHKWAWAENVGWLNWRHQAPDPNGISEGVYVADTYLGGFIWAENVGWINVGDGTPANGVHYANLDDTDFGVNIDAGTDELFGCAWGENVGWVNFAGGALGNPPNPARLVDDCRLRGHVWAENLGWINLDHDDDFVAVLIDGDLDYDGDVDLSDLAQLLANYGMTSGASYEAGDLDGDRDVDLADLAALLAAYGTMCP